MGAFEGSLSFKTFFVEGEPPNDFHDAYLAAIRKLRFLDLTPQDEEDRRLGWVCVDQPLDTDFQRHKVFFNQYVVLGLRVDRWAVPSALLKAHIKQATQDFVQANDVPRLGRTQKDAIKEEVVLRLKNRLVPTMKVVDMAWDVHRKLVRFWTHSAGLCDEFQELFEETFELHLVPDSPFTAARDLALGEAEMEQLANASPTWFVPVAG